MPPTSTPNTDPLALSRALRVAFNRVRRTLRAVSVDGDLPSPQVAALVRIGKEGPTTASALAVAEEVRPQSMATVLGALERAGLIRRTADPTDGRRQLVELTPDGRARFEGDALARESWLARALAERFTDAERATLAEGIALMERLVER